MKKFLLLCLTLGLTTSAFAKPIISCVVKDGSQNILIEEKEMVDVEFVNGELRLPMDTGLPFGSMRLQLGEARAFSVIVKPSLVGSRIDTETNESVWEEGELTLDIMLNEFWLELNSAGYVVPAGVDSSVTLKSGTTTATLGGTGLTHIYKVTCTRL
jgi:hypothetical protein